MNKKERKKIEQLKAYADKISSMCAEILEPFRNVIEDQQSISTEEQLPYQKIEHYFKKQVRAEYGFTPELSYARDRKAIKLFLRTHSKDELRQLIDVFVKSKKAKEIGIALSTMLTPHTINLWKQGLLENKQEKAITFGEENL